VAALEPVNARADGASGFVWRLQTEAGDATGVTGFGDERLIVNMSVWESLEALRAFVYRDHAHLAVLRRRREWFHKHAQAFQVLWWIPDGHIPTVTEAEERLDTPQRHGATPEAFTFSTADRGLCPA
jgi:hypothetical protein